MSDQKSLDQKSRAQKTAESGIAERLAEFIQKNRRVLLFGFVAAIVILFGFATAFTLREKLQERAFRNFDVLDQRFQVLRPYIGSEEINTSRQAELNALLQELNVFTARNWGFAAVRAWAVIAEIHEGEKNWAEAEQAWISAAKAAGKSYLAPVSLFNAAVAAEEQGNIDSAIDLYTQALDHEDIFPAAARAQFFIGRLHESRNDRQAALEAYRTLLSKWPADQLWSNLAQSRIIILSD